MTSTGKTSAPAGRPATGYVPGLDGARALAIILVVLCHVKTGFFYGGGLGVDLFFVLSGFLITGILHRELTRTKTIRLRRFYVRRFVRLYPELLVVVTVMGVIGVLVASHTTNFLVSTLFALTYTTVIPNDLTNWQIINWWSHTWTLSLEELFYLIWPLLLIGAMRVPWTRRHISTLAIILGIALLSVAFLVSWTHEPIIFLRMGAMSLGGGLAMLPEQRWTARPVVGWVGLALFGMSVAGASWTEVVPSPAMWLPSAIGSGLLVAYLARATRGPLLFLFSVPPALYVGRISYSWYLWHWPLNMAVTAITGLNGWSAAAIWIPLSFVLAALTYRLLAPRVDDWKHKVTF